MAFSQSGVFTDTLKDVLEGTTDATFDSTSMRVALYDDSITLSLATHYDATNPAYAAAPFATGEVTGTNWAAKGPILSTPVFTIADPAAGQLSFDAVDVSEANTTIATAFYGCMIFDDAATSTTDAAICAVAFGASYTTSSGTLTITWDANGIFYIDTVP